MRQRKNTMKMNRKEFLKALGIAGTAFATGGLGSLDVFAQEKKDGTTDLVAVMGGEPDVMFQKAIAELGGMGRFVKSGQKVVIKPNIGWDKAPEMAANTHPLLVKEMVKQALEAGASEVTVFDHTCDDWQKCYKNSGIEDAAKEVGAKVVPAHDERYYKEVDIPDGKSLKKTKIHTALLDCDVWFNVPVLKVHQGTLMTIAMKNLMGIVWDRQFFHKNNLNQCIADSCTLVKKPALNVVDAYRIMKSNGPRGRSEADAVLVKALIASTDIVAADATAVKLAQQFTNIPLEDVKHIYAGEELNLGTTDIDSLNVKRVRI